MASSRPDAALSNRSPVIEVEDLRRALRESRLRLRRSALESTKRIAALNAEVTRLETLYGECRQQLARHESGAAIIDLGVKLMQLSEQNDALRETARRMWTLERTIEAAHLEYQRLSEERDALVQALQLNRLKRAF